MSKLFFSSLIIILFLSTIFPFNYAQSCTSGCNYGNCVSENTCACESGYFNSIALCDTQVPSLQNNQYIQKTIPANSWAYFYVSLGDIPSDIRLQFHALEGTATAYIRLQSHDLYNLPRESDESLAITPTRDENPLSYLFIRQEVEATNGGWLTLALHNDGASQAQIAARYIATINLSGNNDSADESSAAFIRTGAALASVFVSLIFCMGIYFKSKTRRMRLTHQQRVHLQVHRENSRQDYELVVIMDPSPQNNQNVLAQLHRQSQVQTQRRPHTPQNQVISHQINLTKEEIHKYFPKRAFAQLSSPFPQGTCSVCLEDFKGESECHQLYCYHIFHETCIGDWLAKHNSCPDCRKLITKEAIKKFFKEQKKQKREKQRQSMEQEQRSQSV